MESAIQLPRFVFVARLTASGSSAVKTHTSYLTFNTKKRQEIIDITDEVENCRAASGITEGFVLVSAMHISASVFVNDHEPGLWKDILDWLDRRGALDAMGHGLLEGLRATQSQGLGPSERRSAGP